MIIRNQNQNGEIVTSGEQFVTDKHAVALGVVRRIKMFFGEYFLNVTDGTIFYDTILGKATDIQREEELKRRILTAPGVHAIIEFNVDDPNRDRQFNCRVRLDTVFGQIEVVEQIINGTNY